VFPRDDGATGNDSKGHGAPNDPNNFQNFPVLTSASVQGTGTIITGTLHADPNKTYRIELFANDSDSLGLPSEGQQFLGFVNATTNGSGDATFGTMVSLVVNTSRTITATATDPDGNTSEFSADHAAVLAIPACDITTLNGHGDPGTAEIEDDLDNPGSHVLIVTGTLQNDSIVIQPRSVAGFQIRVKINDRIVGIFDSDDVQRIIAYGGNGNDRIAVSGLLSQPAIIFGNSGNDTLIAGSGNAQLSGGVGDDKIFGGAANDTLCGDAGNDVISGGAGNDTLFGDAGNDTLNGGTGDDLLLGGAGNDKLDGVTGNDRLYGQAGNDKLVGGTGNNILVGGDGSDSIFARFGLNILIGGNGADKIVGNAGDDILIAGSTAYDENDIALQAILTEWTSGNTYATRVSNIRNGGGANGAFVLSNSTVFNDSSLDNLFGKSGRDWFWVTGKDKIKDRVAGELLN
jgi:Ca2+-binding RTX toxin-like protein